MVCGQCIIWGEQTVMSPNEKSYNKKYRKSRGEEMGKVLLESRILYAIVSLTPTNL